MASWLVITCVGAVLVTIGLFVSGALYPRPVVSRIQQAHDAEMQRLIAGHVETVARMREDGDYYRQAAQSCATAVAHREGQVRTLQALLDQCRKGS